MRVVGQPAGVTVDYDDDVEQVQFGDRMIPQRMMLRFPAGKGNPQLRMVIEVRDGAPLCVALAIESTKTGREVRSLDLKAVRLEDFVEIAVGLVAWRPDQDDPDALVAGGFGLDDQAIRNVRTARSGARRRMTDELLSQVVSTYQTAEAAGRAPGRAVEDAFGVSERTALRYIRECRDRGLLEHSDRSKGSEA